MVTEELKNKFREAWKKQGLDYDEASLAFALEYSKISKGD